MISVIIPTYNEAENIAKLINFLLINGKKDLLEVIVIDGGSVDDTLQEAKNCGAIALASPKKGRAAQMNYGATIAKGEILYFIHADTMPPASFVDDIYKAIAAGYSLGRYRTKFDSKKTALKFNAFFTRFDMFMCYGGDQTLFIKKDLFQQIGGFNETLIIMEDYEIVIRARQKAKYKIIQKEALVSARKYDTNSWFTVQSTNYKVLRMYKKGATQMEMMAAYRNMLRYS